MAVATILVTAFLLYSAAPADAGPPDPRTLLHCPGDAIVTTSVTHDKTTKDSRTPAQLARVWAAAMAAERPRLTSNYQVAYASAQHTDLAFEDTSGQLTAVLSYERDPDLGWRLENIVECG